MGYCVCGDNSPICFCSGQSGLNNKKQWKYFEFEQCPSCGNDVEVLTDTPEGYVQDGNEVRCVDANCGFKSCVSVDDEEIWIQDV